MATMYILEDVDFTPNGDLKSYKLSNGKTIFNNKTICLLHASYCGYCTQFKPDYSKLCINIVNKYPGIDFATIQTDSKEPLQKIFAGPFIQTIIKGPLRGVPHIVKFENGKYAGSFQGNRNSAAELTNWILQ
jgi:thiol-disulfide isomerase/thioredoxin